MALSREYGEVLVDIGTIGLERSVTWTVVQSEMGDGAHAAVTVGSASGVRRWKLKWEAIFDDLPLIQPRRGDGSIQNIDGGVTPPLQARPHYLQRFISRRFQNFDSQGLYFWIFDVLEGKYYAARFEDTAIAYSQVTTARQWSSGLSIIEVRMAGSPADPGTPPALIAP